MTNPKLALAAVSASALIALAGCQAVAPQAKPAEPANVPQPPVAAQPAPAQPARLVAESQQMPIVAVPGSPSQSGITVAGEGIVRTEPDIAYISTGVLTRGATAKAAQDDNTRAMNAVIVAIERLGVAKADIRTSGVNLSPVYDRQPNQISGYQAMNTVRITVQDVAKTGELLDAAVQAGANQAGQIQFGLKNDSPQRRQALDQAVKEARVKADAIAAAAGIRIVGIQSLMDESSSGPMAPEMSTRMAMADQAMAGPVPVQPGQLAVTARVRVVYAFQ